MTSPHDDVGSMSLKDIEQWIAELYEEDKTDTPQFIDTPKNRKIMSSIIHRNKEVEKDADVAMHMSAHISQKYLEKSQEINCLIQDVVKDVNPDILKRVESLAVVANSMNLKLPTLTNFLLGMSALNEKKMNQDLSELTLNHEISELSLKISDIMKKNEILKREVTKLERISNDQQPLIPNSLEMESKFFSAKIKEYNRRIKKLKEELESGGYEASLSHANLVAKAESAQELERELNNLTAQLETYQDLPPNEMVAKLKTEEAKKELNKLQNDFEALLQNIC